MTAINRRTRQRLSAAIHLSLVLPGLWGCSFITRSSFDECDETGVCEEPPACDPMIDLCEGATGGADPNANGSSGGAPPLMSTGGTGSAGGSESGGGTVSTGGSEPMCVPRTEICNGVDDDCNDSIDEGCPSAFAWTNPIEEESVGDSFGGTYFESNCEADEVLVGLRATLAGLLDSVGALCSKAQVKPIGTSIPYNYELSLSQPRYVPGHNDAESPTEMLCGAGQAMVGLRIALQNFSNDGTDFVVATRMWIQCAPISMNGIGEIVINLDSKTEKGPESGTFFANTAWFQEFATGKVPTGLHGMGGSWIDRVGLKTGDGAVN